MTLAQQKELNDILNTIDEVFEVEINDFEALTQEYIDICGYSREDAEIAAKNTLKEDNILV